MTHRQHQLPWPPQRTCTTKFVTIDTFIVLVPYRPTYIQLHSSGFRRPGLPWEQLHAVLQLPEHRGEPDKLQRRVPHSPPHLPAAALDGAPTEVQGHTGRAQTEQGAHVPQHALPPGCNPAANGPTGEARARALRLHRLGGGEAGGRRSECGGAEGRDSPHRGRNVRGAAKKTQLHRTVHKED